MRNFKVSQILIFSAMAFAAGHNNSQAALLELSHEPLFLSQAVPPAIAVTFDDSGSMERGYVIGLGDNRYARFADPTENRLYYNPNITYLPPIGHNGVPFPQANPEAARVDGFTHKIAAIDITKNYVPLFEIDYETDGKVRIEFARGGHPDLYNIRRNESWRNEYPGKYAITWNEYANTGVKPFYTRKVWTSPTEYYYEIVNVPETQHKNFANWYSYYNTRMKLGRSAVSRAFSTFGPSFKITWQQLNRNTTFPAINRFEDDHRKKFFDDWLFKIPTSGGTPLRDAFLRSGKLFEKGSSYDTKGYDIPITCQQNFHIAISDGAWKEDFDQSGNGSVTYDESARTPHLPGDTEGRYAAYDGDGVQAIYSSDDDLKTLSDISFHFWSRDLMPLLDNNVSLYGRDFTDRTGAQIAPGPGQTEWDLPEFIWNPKNDPAYWQHMVTYNIGLGLNATLVEDYIDAYGDSDPDTNAACPEKPSITDPKEAVLAGLRAEECKWPEIPTGDEFDEIVEKVDDVYHSSINSRGDFFSASDPEELVAALNKVINNIIERLSSGGSTVTSGIVTSNTRAFTPAFNSSSWSGNLVAREVNDISGFGNPIWDLACTLTGGYCTTTGTDVPKQNLRHIYAYDKPSKSVVRFEDDLSGNAATVVANASEEFRTDFNVTVADIVNYVAGDDSNEINNGGPLRNRDNLLSDIIHASPVVIRGPGESFDDSLWPADSVLSGRQSYLEFKIANQDRENVVFIGSNSGMLHAVKVDGSSEGKELWGFVPYSALKNIHRLAEPDYQTNKWSYVDNTPILGDAYFNDKWNSVMIGGMRYGGQAFYALDVTDPTTNEPKVLWEFTDEDDADMGFSYGQATIMRVSSTDEWVALIPNGYNNSELDYPDPTDPRNRLGDGTAVLYVVRLSDGKLLAKLDTNEGTRGTPNGLSTAIAVDSNQIDGGVDLGADYAYAGDVYGNLWRFDFRSSDYDDWKTSIEKVYTADIALERPITQQPRVIFLPSGDVTNDKDSVVMFGTGKYIESPDRTISIQDQYIVGIYDGIKVDRSGAPISITDDGFVEQYISNNGPNLRKLSDEPVDFSDPDLVGWKINLIDQGERVNTPLELLGAQILLVATSIPKGDDPCQAGGTGWVMAINPRTGATPVVGEIFDDEFETTDTDGNPITIVGTGTGVKVYDPPAGRITILENQGGGETSLVIEGSTSTTIISLEKFSWRRRNWTNLLTE